MTTLPPRFMTLITFVLTLCVASIPNSVFAAGTDTPSPPPPPSSATKSKPPKTQPPKTKSDTSDTKKFDDQQSNIDDSEFIQAYRVAYATIYERNDYVTAVAQLKALGQDDRADVANLIGYSYRKLGDYRLSQIWYERALKADPTHVRTWQYYGLWQVEQGHRDRAKNNLAQIEKLCGTGCPEYRSLAEAIDGTSSSARASY